MANPAAASASPPRALALAELARICQHKLFRRSEVLRQMLTFLVECELEQRPVGEPLLAEKFLGLSASEFHPYTNSYVRVNTSQLRKRLAAYYRDSPESGIRFHLPQGSFRLRFELLNDNAEAWMRAFAQAKLLSGSRYIDELESALHRISAVLAARPEFAPAYALRSHCYLMIGAHGGDPVASAAAARPAAAKAFELAPESWPSLAAAASIAGLVAFDWPTAESLYARAAAVPGNELWADPWYQATLVAQGRLEECLNHMRQALFAYPLPPRSLQQNFGVTLHLAGRFEEAEQEFIQTCEVLPDDFGAWLWRSIQALHLGRRAQGIQYVARAALVARGRMPGTLLQSMRDFLLTGKIRRPQAHPGGAAEVARLVPLAARQSEAALVPLTRMVESRNAIAGVFLRSPILTYLHTAPGFLALCNQMRVPRPVRPNS